MKLDHMTERILQVIYMDIKNNNWSIVGEGDRDSVNKIFKKGGGEIE